MPRHVLLDLITFNLLGGLPLTPIFIHCVAVKRKRGKVLVEVVTEEEALSSSTVS